MSIFNDSFNLHEKATNFSRRPSVPILRSTAKRKQWTMTLLANMSIFSSGMALGFPAISLQLLSSPSEPVYLDSDQASWFASINTITCPLGGLLASVILDRIGRKRTMMTVNFISIIAWCLQSWTPVHDATVMYYQLLGARLLLGLGGGLATTPVSVYAAEIAHPNLRGRLTIMSSASMGVGILLIYFFGFLFQDNWKLNSKIALGISVVALIGTLVIPESPQWLARKGKLVDAEAAYRRINGRGPNDKNASLIGREAIEMIEMCKKVPRDKGQPKESTCQKLCRRNVYKPLGILLVFLTIQQLCGLFVQIVYIGSWAEEIGITFNIFTFTVITGLVRFAGLMVSTFGSDQLGRRKLALISVIGVAISTIAILICLWIPAEKSEWIAGSFLIFYVFISTVGLLTVPFAMIAELYPADVRGLCAGLNICYVYLVSFVLIKCYPYATAAMGVNFVMICISVSAIVGAIFLYRFLPETNGKTMKEIQEIFDN